MSDRAATPSPLPGGRDEHDAQAVALLEALRALIGETDSDGLLERLADLFQSRLSGCATQIWLRSRSGVSAELRLGAQAGFPEARSPERNGVASEFSFLHRIAAEREPILVTDARTDSRLEEDHEWLTAAGVSSLLGAPLVIEGEPPLGVVLLLCREPGGFSPEQLALVQALASTSAVAIRNARLHEELAGRAAQAEQLSEIARVVNSARSAKRAFGEVCQRAAFLCGADRGSIWLWDGTATRVIPAASRYATGQPDVVEAARFTEMRARLPKKNGGFITRMVETRRPVLIADACQSPLIDPLYVEWFRLRSLLGVPLLVDDKPVGALVLDRKELRPFTAAETALACAVSDQVAFAIHKTLLLEETADRLRQTEAQLEISRTLSSTLELKPLLMHVARQAARVCGMDRCSIYLWDEERVVPVMSQYADGREDLALWRAFKNLGRMRVEEMPFFAETVRRQGPVVIDHPAEDPLVPRTLDVFRLTALLAVPLILQEKVVGAIALDNTGRQRPVTPAQVTLATTIASQVALAVDNAQLQDETQRRLRETIALLSVAQTLGGGLDAQEIARRSARELALLLRADTAVFFSVDEAKEKYQAMAGYHVPAHLRQSRWGIPSDLPAFAIEARSTGRPVASSDVSEDPRFDHSDIRSLAIPPRALIYAPVVSQGLHVGALVSYWWTEARQFTEEELELTAGVAAQMSPVLESARLYAQAQGALAELKATQERLVQSEKSRAVAEIAAGVAHDFNNLLAAVLGRTQFLLHSLNKGAMAPAEVRRNLVIVERAALDGAETVKRLLEFTRAAPPAGEAGVVDIGDLLAQTVEVSRYRWKDEAEAHGLRIDVRLEPGETLPVLGNAADLRRVLLNLVLNAIDAMPEGGALTLSSRTEGDRVCVRLRDTGTGMSDEVKGRVFDPFFTTKGPQSSGLGLSASQGIVRSYGGDITVESALGQGTTFTLSLTAAAARANALPTSRPELEPRGRALRILVIDDDEAVRATLHDLLVEVGHQVWEAQDGASGLELLDTQPVDLVITDLGMPGMTGWEVAARVKARWPDRKVALVTGWGAQIGPEELKAHGVDLLLAKPFRFDEILGLTI